MPTPASARYPKPSDWNEFENICLGSFRTRWRSPNLQRYGRQGQAQQGVDIYGPDNLGQLVGVQCKNTVHAISETLIDAEILEAEKFTPPIRALYIATSADTDAKLQAYVRSLSIARARAGKFQVDIVFWDAIVHDLAGDQAELSKHYAQFFGAAIAGVMAGSTPHARDTETLTNLLSVIDIESTQLYLDYAPKYIDIRFLEHTRNFLAVVASPTFHLYDKALESHLHAWLAQWSALASLIRETPAYDLQPNGYTLFFRMPGDAFASQDDQGRYDQILAEDQEFFRLQKIFCDYVIANFFGINLVQTSQAARKFYAIFA